MVKVELTVAFDVTSQTGTRKTTDLPVNKEKHT